MNFSNEHKMDFLLRQTVSIYNKNVPNNSKIPNTKRTVTWIFKKRSLGHKIARIKIVSHARYMIKMMIIRDRYFMKEK